MIPRTEVVAIAEGATVTRVPEGLGVGAVDRLHPVQDESTAPVHVNGEHQIDAIDYEQNLVEQAKIIKRSRDTFRHISDVKKQTLRNGVFD